MATSGTMEAGGWFVTTFSSRELPPPRIENAVVIVPDSALHTLTQQGKEHMDVLVSILGFDAENATFNVTFGS
jgi:hypothetical protein